MLRRAAESRMRRKKWDGEEGRKAATRRITFGTQLLQRVEARLLPILSIL
jgi:hypothetical protein